MCSLSSRRQSKEYAQLRTIAIQVCKRSDYVYATAQTSSKVAASLDSNNAEHGQKMDLHNAMTPEVRNLR